MAVLSSPVVLLKSAATDGRVAAAGGVAIERSTDGSVGVAGGVATERTNTIGRVVDAGGVAQSASTPTAVLSSPWCC